MQRMCHRTRPLMQTVLHVTTSVIDNNRQVKVINQLPPYEMELLTTVGLRWIFHTSTISLLWLKISGNKIIIRTKIFQYTPDQADTLSCSPSTFISTICLFSFLPRFSQTDQYHPHVCLVSMKQRVQINRLIDLKRLVRLAWTGTRGETASLAVFKGKKHPPSSDATSHKLTRYIY